MIAGCPKCSARYRIDAGRLGPDGARLRCTQCGAVFRVTPPPAAEAPSAPDGTAPVSETSPPPAETPPVSAPPPVAAGGGPPEPTGPVVLVADPNPDSAKETAGAVAGWGFQPLLVHDGVEAVLTIQRALPRVVVLDAALPRMFGFQICELVKRNEQLRPTQVILVGAIHDEDRYRRDPSDLYGADAYVERPQLPEALRPLLDALVRGMPVPGGTPPIGSPPPDPAPPPAPATGEPAPVEAPAPAPVEPAPVEAPVSAPVEPVPPVPAAPAEPVPPVPAAPAEPVPPVPAAPAEPAPVVPAAPAEPAPQLAAAPAAQAVAEADPEVAAAERLARIVVSDIVLYNPEKFEEGIRNANVVDVLTAELEEGRALFETRVDARVREGRDFLAEELVRVARSRGMA